MMSQRDILKLCQRQSDAVAEQVALWKITSSFSGAAVTKRALTVIAYLLRQVIS